MTFVPDAGQHAVQSKRRDLPERACIRLCWPSFPALFVRGQPGYRCEPMQRDLEPLRNQVDQSLAMELSRAAAKLLIYPAFISVERVADSEGNKMNRFACVTGSTLKLFVK